MIDVNEIEAIWLTLNVAAAALGWASLRDALADREAIRKLNGRARELVAGGDVRRARVRLLMELAFIVVVIPNLLTPGASMLTVGRAIVMVLPMALVLDGLLDARERRRLAATIPPAKVAKA